MTHGGEDTKASFYGNATFVNGAAKKSHTQKTFLRHELAINISTRISSQKRGLFCPNRGERDNRCVRTRRPFAKRVCADNFRQRRAAMHAHARESHASRDTLKNDGTTMRWMLGRGQKDHFSPLRLASNDRVTSSFEADLLVPLHILLTILHLKPKRCHFFGHFPGLVTTLMLTDLARAT